MLPPKGGGQTKNSLRPVSAHDIALPEGYKIEPVSTELTFPSALAFDNDQHIYVIESGYSYGEVFLEPRLLRLNDNGGYTEIAKGGKNGPWTGLTFYKGNFYVAEGGVLEGGKILKISPTGKITTIVRDLPTKGDHHTNGPVIKDGYIYFGQGTATNSGVVGTDNGHFGWLKRHPEFHDTPCKDIFLTGINYESDNPLTDDPNDKAQTGAYSAFNTKTSPGQLIKGAIPCSGSILRVPLDGGPIELVAWGLRNPFGLAVAPSGSLYITENAFDERGSRPVWGSGDVLWEIKQGLWYGWPDFSAGKPIQNDEEFKAPGQSPVKAVLQKYPNTPPKSAAILGVHSSSNGLDFSTNSSFGHTGEAFIAQFGDMSPDAGKVLSPVGFKVVRVNVDNGVINDFAVNKGHKNGPASMQKKGGLERPLSVKFNPSGDALYIVDFGVMNMTKKGAEPQAKTGTIWRVTKK